MAQKPRSIFQDVGAADKTDVAKTAPGGIDGGAKGARGPIRKWLMVIFEYN